MRSLLTLCSAALVVVFSSGASLYAQEAAPPPAHISYLQGSVTIDHGGGDSEPAAINMPVVEGDRIVTASNGRAEVMFPDGAAIAIDPESEIEFVGAARVRVIAGAIEHRPAVQTNPRSASAQYLPPELRPYGPDLDQNGAWQSDPQYGSVWYPTTVTADWRPYYDGYWYSAPSYGWTWIGDGRWTWPTHHYGRWGYARNRWFWIPGRTYAAAWVSWGTAPDYVSWCPLGYDGRPVVALSVGYRNTWNAWTVVRRDHFGARGYSPRRYAVDPYRIAANTAFVEHRTPPSRDRRGSFSVGARDGQDRRQPYADPRRGAESGSVGVAVPRYDAGDDERGRRGSERPSSSDRATSSGDRSAGYGDRTTGSVGRTGNPRRETAPVTATPAPEQAQPDSPAYRPRYQPRYEPGASQPTPGYRDRRMGGGEGRATAQPQPAERPAPQQERSTTQTRERSAPRGSAPAAPSAPSSGSTPPPAASAPPSPQRERGAAPARERSQDGQSTGTAVRRPR